MKTLVLSDIHANIYALEAIWAHEKDSELIICTGDLVDYGPEPRPVLDWVRAHDVRCTQGNHDRFVAYCYRNNHTEETIPAAERLWAHYTASRLEEADIRFLEELPCALTLDLNGTRYGMTHLYRDYEIINSLNAFAQFGAETFESNGDPLHRMIFGHTHRQVVYYLSNEKFWLNPGSISYRRPDDPDQTAHYMTIIDNEISMHRLAYDITPVYRYLEHAEVSEKERKQYVRYFGPRPLDT